ncbi:MAG: STAS domain-containing protein [bacterium]
MLHITMPLSTSIDDKRNEKAGIDPVAAVEIDVRGNDKFVNIQLKGAIAGENAVTFFEFLKAVSLFVGTRWTLQMKDLSILSMQGIQHLVQFAQILRARGYRLEVVGVHRNVYTTLQDLKAVNAFAWTD